MLSHYVKTQTKEYYTREICPISGIKQESYWTEAKERNVSCVSDDSAFLIPSPFQHTA
jgi:hypothetical protein